MASLNKVFLIGNLTRDVEVRYTPAGKAVAGVGIAVNQKWKDANGEQHEDVTFVDLTIWGKTAELAAQYLGKGSSVHVSGRLRTETWDDKQTGQKRSKLSVTVDELQFLDSKRQDGAPRQRTAVDSAREAQQRPRATPPPYEGDAGMDGDEIPF